MKRIHEVLQEFKVTIEKLYGKQLKHIILYQSETWGVVIGVSDI